MSERGVFAIDRGCWEHDFLADSRPFSRREAWFWLVSEAAWKKHKRRILGRAISLERGQLAASYRFIASKWRWSEARVRRFISGAVSEGMVDAKTDAGITVITICNYDHYQRVSLPDDAMSDSDADAKTDAGATQERRKVEDKENKEEVITSTRAREKPTDDWPADYEAQFWVKWPNKVAKVPGMKALAKARKRVAFGVMMAGLDRFIQSTNPQFYGHPASWLNADRWTDEPRNDNGSGTRDNRTARAPGSPKTGADAILAGMGRIASRIRERGTSTGSGDGTLPLSHDTAKTIDAEPGPASGDREPHSRIIPAFRSDAVGQPGPRSENPGSGYEDDVLPRRAANF